MGGCKNFAKNQKIKKKRFESIIFVNNVFSDIFFEQHGRYTATHVLVKSIDENGSQVKRNGCLFFVLSCCEYWSSPLRSDNFNDVISTGSV